MSAGRRSSRRRRLPSRRELPAIALGVTIVAALLFGILELPWLVGDRYHPNPDPGWVCDKGAHNGGLGVADGGPLFCVKQPTAK